MAATDPSTPPPNAQDDKDAAEARAATMAKVVDRLREVDERIGLIVAAAKTALLDMIRIDPMGRVVDTLEDYDLVVSGNKALSIVGIEGRLSELKGLLSYAKEVSMPERMDREEIKSFNTEDNRITRTQRTLASIAEGQKDEALQWLRDNDFGSLIQETVNASTLSAAAKELIEGGRELPADEGDPFRVYFKDGVSITRKKKA